MTLFQAFLSGLTGIAVMFLVFNLHIFWHNRQPIYLACAMACLGMIIYIPCNMLLYQTTLPDIYVHIVQVQMYGTAIFFMGVIWLFTKYLSYNAYWLLVFYSLGFGLFLIVRMINVNLFYERFDGMLVFHFLWGETVWLPEAQISIWCDVYVYMILSIYFVLGWLCVRAYRRGDKTQSGRAVTALALMFATTLHDGVVLALNLRWLFLAETGFVLLILLMELVITSDLMLVNTLAEEIKHLNAQLEQRVAERTVQLEAANQELEAFSYSVSHDLRSPLRAINGFSKILKEDFTSEFSPEADSFLEKIVQSGKKMERLIDELLDFSRLGRKNLERQAVEIAPLVQAVIETLTPETAGRQIQWVLPDLPTVQADPFLLQQVYANLIGNAVKYSRTREQARIEIGGFSENGQMVCFVRDNGVGFDMQYVDKLFGVFQRLHSDSEFEGTGIGLATVQRIIHRHGGRIWAEAEVGKGATFYFTLE